ncbi:signal peptidase I [Rikenella microfusus]|uniref:Signal peptidase I n=1 Tax=Rikenella microfusus TaxID=28139 RepID=A0A379MSY7_9BACT|nr:signal peptidase I [Rikenella microfusus]SUE34645.1 Signal peptidase I [Rikenella microfusus]HJE88367.1 signal peptidase I [Rikenella microfusus]
MTIRHKRKWWQKLLRGLGIAFLTIAPGAFVVMSRFFCWEMFTIPTESMYPTLLPGDRVIVNKAVFGARLHRTFESMGAEKPDILRWKYRGYRPLRRGDIIVFNYPYARGWGKIAFDFNTLYVKRCVALPGDSVYAERGAVRVRGVEGTVGIRQYQRQLAFADLSLYPPQSWQTIAPDSAAGKWTIRDFGPIYVPRQGDTIPLDRRNIALYAPAVEFETGVRPRIDSTGRTRLGDSTITHYTFRRNFYFACGDNTMASMDSRYWGFIPEDFVLGVVTRVAYSYDREREKVRWNRIWKNTRWKE